MHYEESVFHEVSIFAEEPLERRRSRLPHPSQTRTAHAADWAH